MSSETEFLTSYDCIKTSFKQAMSEIDTAVRHEENERLEDAIKSYELCVDLINAIFEIPVGLPDNLKDVEPEWNDACAIIQKLKNTKSEISYRLTVLRKQDDIENGTELTGNPLQSDDDDRELEKTGPILLENPTVFSGAIADDDVAAPPKTYREIITGLRDVIAAKGCDVSFDTLFDGFAKVYKIQNNGVVTTVAGETPLTLVICNVGGKWKYLNGIYFLQCSFSSTCADSSDTMEAKPMIWVYPLIPKISTCYRTEYGAYIFPDLESLDTNSVFGIMICDDCEEVPVIDGVQQTLTVKQQYFQYLLEAILADEIVVISEPGAERQAQHDTSQVVSRKIVTTADFIARHLIGGAEKTGELIFKSTPYIMSKLKAAPPDGAPVYSTVQTSVDVAKTVTGAAAGVTYWMAGKVGSASMALGRYLAPHIQTQGAYLLENGLGYNSEEAQSKMEGAFTIAAGALEGFSSVYNGLETSAKILGKSLSSNSVKIIEHKYGPSAGNVAAGTFDTIGNAFNVSRNLNYITPKGIANKMVKNTGKAVVIGYKNHAVDDARYVRAGVLYPDLTALKNAHQKGINDSL